MNDVHLSAHQWRKKLLPLISLVLLVGCASTIQQEAPSVLRWDNRQETILFSTAVPEGLLLLRKTAVRIALEVYDPQGALLARTLRDYPVVKVYAPFNHSVAYFIEEISPQHRLVWRWRWPAEPECLTDQLNWIDLLLTADERIWGFESLFTTYGHLAPSGVRIHDLDAKRVLYEDMRTYYAPVGTLAPLILSPVDITVRCFGENGPADRGALNDLLVSPVVSMDRRFAAWLGPSLGGSRLFLSNEAGEVRQVATPLLERPPARTSDHQDVMPAGARPMYWIGDQLAIAYQDETSLVWNLQLFDPVSGLPTANIPVPEYAKPSAWVSDPAGRYLGLPTPHGSLLINRASGLSQAFLGVSISEWRFSPDGKHLYIVLQDRLQVVAL